MVNYFIYAKDFSESTAGNSYYHSNGLETLEQFKKDVERIKEDMLIAGEAPTESKMVYLHWGDECWEVDEDETRKAYINLESGKMCTDPATIIQYLKSKYITDETDKMKLLYIITDGLIDDRSAVNCSRNNEDMHYERVIFHAFNNECVQDIDLSVTVSFFKSHCTVYCNNEMYDSTDISKEFDYDKINIDNFEAEKYQLKSYIRLKFINTFKRDAVALQEIEKLKKLRNRLFDELSSINKSKFNLETKDRNIFLHEFCSTDWYKNLSASVYVGKVAIEKSISTFINYIVSREKSYSFDVMKYELKFHKDVQKEQIVDVNFSPEQEIEFPDIILDDEKGIPVVILTKFSLMDKIIFHKTQSSEQVKPASFSKFKSTMECPLFLMYDRDISESIGYFYTLNVYKQLLENNTKTEPRTRRPFHGGLVLIDSDQLDKYNDYILSATYFDSKKFNYNIGLFYFVLWKNCERKEWIDRNVVNQFKKYAMRRISETVCNIGLSSLPLDPQENTSLLTALWYCVELSSHIFKNDCLHFQQERLRMYYGVACYMIEILKYFNYDLNLESIEKRRDLISHVMILKKIDKPREKVYYLLKRIFKTVDGFLVSEIENPFNLYKLNYLKLNHKEMLNDEIVEEEVHLKNYIHLMHFVGDSNTSMDGQARFEICDKTLRPYFVIDQNKSFYTELVKNTKKVVINNDGDKDKIEIIYKPIDSLEFDRILSLYKLFINCVQESGKYPTLAEYVKYVSKKKKFNDDLVTIFPANVYVAIKEVYECYQEIVRRVSVKGFIRIGKTYVHRRERIKAEKRVKTFSDNDISKFIYREEVAVNLRKKKV